MAAIVPGNNNSGPGTVSSLGDGRAIFDATSGTVARELWITDGTSAGTSLVKDINTLPDGSSVPTGVPPLSPGHALMTADNGAVGSELWLTDGTDGGTSLLKNINPGSASSYGRYFSAFGAGALFVARTATGGTELWYTDGTESGMTLVKDIRVGSADSFIGRIVSLGGLAVFSANNGSAGAELWVTDGSTAGTSLLLDIQPGTNSGYPRDLTSLGNGKAIFRASDGTIGNELWVTDGTAAGTSLVGDLNPGVGSFISSAPVAIGGGRALLVGSTAAYGSEIWVTDGTLAGTSLLADVVPGSTGSSPGYLTPLGNGLVVFAATTAAAGAELWETNGTPGGTQMLRDFLPGTGSSGPRFFRATGNGRALFEGNDPVTGRETWVTDGTVAGTKLLKDINPVTATSNPGTFTLFQTNDPPVLSTPIANRSIDEDAPFSFAVPSGTFTDPNPWDSPLSYSAQLVGGGALPAWLTFGPSSATFNGTPANGDVGTVSIRIIAADSFGITASDVFNLTVVNTNDTPVASAYTTSVVEDATGPNLWSSLLALATDDDLIHGDSLTLSGVGTVGTLGHVSFDAGTQTLRYIADADAFDALATGQVLPDQFTYTVRDLTGATSTATVTASVTGIDDSVISFAVHGVSDPSLGGSIDGAAGASNATQNRVVANEFVVDNRDRFQQLLAFVDNMPGGSLDGEVGADLAYNLSDIGNGPQQTSLSAANNSLDPVPISAYGMINNKSLGVLPDGIRFIHDSFGVNSGPEGESMGRWLNDGDSLTFAATGYDGNVNYLIRSVRFVVDARSATADVILDWDGAVTEDLNGPNQHGGFATEAEALGLNAVADDAPIVVDFYARTIQIDGIEQTGAQSWFAAREAAGCLGALTLGASISGGALALRDLQVETVAGKPASGGGFVNSLF